MSRTSSFHQTQNARMIEEIMKPNYQTYELDECKKYRNRNFVIVIKDNIAFVVDKRTRPYNIHMDIPTAFNNIVKKT